MRSPPPDRTELPALSRFLEHCGRRTVRPGRMIIHAGDPPDCLYYLVAGSVEVVIEDERGDEIVLAYLNKGHFFGEMGLFHGRAERTARVRSRTHCELAEMTYDRFAALSAGAPELTVELASQIANRIASTNGKVADLAFLSVAGRVAHALLDLAREPDALDVPGRGTRILLTRPQLARLVGCSREMASRVLRTMEQQRLIESTPDGVLLLDETSVGRRREAG